MEVGMQDVNDTHNGLNRGEDNVHIQSKDLSWEQQHYNLKIFLVQKKLKLFSKSKWQLHEVSFASFQVVFTNGFIFIFAIHDSNLHVK
jgi:hypothetical protein